MGVLTKWSAALTALLQLQRAAAEPCNAFELCVEKFVDELREWRGES
jgi:hypothetical protein